jgi:hypothetical protein
MMVTFTSSGNHSITSQYSGNASYGPSTSSPWNATALYPTTMTVSPNNTTINLGASATITANVVTSYKVPAITGPITFFVSGAPVSGSASTVTTDASGNQVLSATLTISPQAQYQIVQAVYQSDGNFQSASNTANVSVNIPDFTLPQNTTITVTAGQSQTALVNVTPLSTMPSSVTFSSPPPNSLPSGMSLTFSPTTANLNGAVVPVTLTLSTTGPSGGPVAAVKNVTSAAMVAPTVRRGWFGTLASGLLLSFVLCMPKRRYKNGVAFFAAIALIITIPLGCGGGGSVEGGGGGGPAVTSITLATSNAKIAMGGSFTLTATVTSSRAITGTINIFQGTAGQGAGVAPPISVVNGKASAVVTVPFGPGIYPFWANYSGDANNQASQSTTTVQQVITGSRNGTFYAQTAGLSHQGNITINLQ